jgi:putative sugar O-methyltransferase
MMNARINEMLEALSHAREEVLPSKFWEDLNHKNVKQLETDGYENFKSTIARNYFTWIAGVSDLLIRSQLDYLTDHLPITTWLPVTALSFLTGPYRGFSWKHTVSNSLLGRLLWAYAVSIDTNRSTRKLSEPAEGNPLPVYYGSRRISQDLGNAFLEYHAVMNAMANADAVKTVMELGAGYGRTGYVFLKLHPNIRYIVVDIPPALYISERYLSNQFAESQIFRFRPFDKFETVAEEFEKARIAFLLPNQIEMLPDKYVDLFLNVSSLHEMHPAQIRYFLNQIDRLTQGFFYMKQWKKWFNDLDNVQMTEDYPIPPHWTKLFWRECRVQTFFFEALFGIQ